MRLIILIREQKMLAWSAEIKLFFEQAKDIFATFLVVIPEEKILICFKDSLCNLLLTFFILGGKPFTIFHTPYELVDPVENIIVNRTSFMFESSIVQKAFEVDGDAKTI